MAMTARDLLRECQSNIDVLLTHVMDKKDTTILERMFKRIDAFLAEPDAAPQGTQERQPDKSPGVIPAVAAPASPEEREGALVRDLRRIAEWSTETRRDYAMTALIEINNISRNAIARALSGKTEGKG